MTAPAWLKWINPAPKDDAELAVIEKAIQDVVWCVKGDLYIMVHGPLFHSNVRKIKDQLDALGMILETTPDSALIDNSWKVKGWKAAVASLNADVTGLIEEEDEFLDSCGGPLPPKKAGRPSSDSKSLCVYWVRDALIEHGKKHGMHRTGPVVNLSHWVWVEAGGDDMTTMSAWGSVAEGVVKELKQDQEIDPNDLIEWPR